MIIYDRYFARGISWNVVANSARMSVTNEASARSANQSMIWDSNEQGEKWLEAFSQRKYEKWVCS